MKPLRYCVVLSMITALLGGCCGGGTTVQPTPSTITTGQQLLDLKKAYTEGAITEEQYNKMKKEIIDNSCKK